MCTVRQSIPPENYIYEEFIDSLGNLLSSSDLDKIIIGGDFNCDFNDLSDDATRMLKTTLES